MRGRAARWSLLGLGAWAAAAGCGHSVEPRAPYQAADRLPVPSDLRVGLTLGGDVLLTWRASAGDRAVVDGWIVERRRSTESDFVSVGPALVRDTTYLDNTIGDGERAAYRVRAITGAGLASLPAESNLIRSDRFGPSAPTGLTVAPLSAALRISFVASPEPDVQLYLVRLEAQNGSEPPRDGSTLASPDTVSGLTPGIAYGVTVTAVDSAGRVSFPPGTPVVGVPGP
ncbi:MAG: fibronectin type III domain-containing protein [Candidatus Eisenbacteria bacterium]